MISSRAEISLCYTLSMTTRRAEGSLSVIASDGGRVQGCTDELFFRIQSIISNRSMGR